MAIWLEKIPFFKFLNLQTAAPLADKMPLIFDENEEIN
jgi:hypothetical protein